MKQRCGPLRGHDQCCWAWRQKRGEHEPASPGQTQPRKSFFISPACYYRNGHTWESWKSIEQRMPLYTVPTQIQQLLTFCYTCSQASPVCVCVCVCIHTMGEYSIYVCIVYTHMLPRWLSGKESACNAGGAGDSGLIPELGRSPGGGTGNPLQHSCLENPRR